MHLLHFAGSNSTRSINKQLARYAASLIDVDTRRELDLNDFEMPIYSPMREKSLGIPRLAYLFAIEINKSDGIILSLAEYNGSYTTAFKNVFDWVSRIDQKIWQEKPMFLLATSPGKRGGRSVLDAALARFPFMGGKVVSSFSLPEFGNNFDPFDGITHGELNQQFTEQLAIFAQSMKG